MVSKGFCKLHIFFLSFYCKICVLETFEIFQSSMFFVKSSIVISSLYKILLLLEVLEVEEVEIELVLQKTESFEKIDQKTGCKLYRFSVLITQRDLHHSVAFTYLLMVSRLTWVSVTYVTFSTQILIGSDTI